jgi:uncharacterized membrane protein
MNKNKIIGVFDDEDDVVKCMKKIVENDIRIEEVYTPYPIHEVLELKKSKSVLTVVAFVYGAVAVALVLSFLYFTSVISWPLNYGGKPSNAFPSFIVITIILTIFTVTILSLFTFSVRAKVWPGQEDEVIDTRATDDKFVIYIKKYDGLDEKKLNDILSEFSPSEIYEK